MPALFSNSIQGFVGETISAICTFIRSTRSKNARHIYMGDGRIRRHSFQSFLLRTIEKMKQSHWLLCAAKNCD